MEQAVRLARRGGTVLWICNTIEGTQNQYKHFTNLIHDQLPVGLIHSRFPYWRREELENKWMERFGKEGITRCGSILISTQIVEQSVDLDADLLITELAPTDMLLQRLGRLWRHDREDRPPGTIPQIIIIEESKNLEEFRSLSTKAIIEVLGSKAKVYAPYILLRSLVVWNQCRDQEIIIPSQIRELLESTYDTEDNEPEAWEQLSNEWFGTDSAKEMLAYRNSNLWQLALDDREGVQTRINEIPIVSLVLCKSLNKQMVTFVDGSEGIVGGNEFHLATAQAIHRNLVKVPEYCFTRVSSDSPFSEYLYGSQAVGIVKKNGLDVQGLKNGLHLFYTDTLGLTIEKSS